ncbi:MAG: hypothetical protein ACE5E6_03060 [Phycisphaerae bacterium]
MGSTCPSTDRHLLVVEPESLLRWSLTTYFQKWYTTHPAGSVDDAMDVLSRERIDALILAGELPDGDADRIATQAKAGNPDVVMVETVADTTALRHRTPHMPCIEKPFKLAKLAALLGAAPRPSDARS